MATARVFIDYQNVHHTAHEKFGKYGEPIYQSLIHPGQFANQAAIALRSVIPDDVVTVTEVNVYRGTPNPRKEPTLNSHVTKQQNTWKRDPRVVMNSRPIRYPHDWPGTPAQEKGIDVLLALGVVRAALEAEDEWIIIATRDTDIIPAVEMAAAEHPGKIAVACWDGSGKLNVDCDVVHLRLREHAFRACVDHLNNH